MKWSEVCALGKELPEVTEDTWYGTPALKVRGKGFVRLKEDGASIVFMLPSLDEQEFLIETQPNIYFITDHYRGWASVLARLRALRPSECRTRLRQSYLQKAPKTLVKRLTETPAPPQKPPKPANFPKKKARVH